MTTPTRIDALTEPDLVAFTEQALALLHERYTDGDCLLERFGEAAADDVRLAIENAREGFDRFVDHFRHTRTE